MSDGHVGISVIAPRKYEDELVEECAACYADPLRFVLTMYDWPIKGEPGPDEWQRDVLLDIGRQVRARRFDGSHPVAPIRIALSTGHGIGKGALWAWLVDWIMSTRRNCHGTVTAATADQLDKKTWAQIREWTAKCATSHWFEINAAIMYRKGHRATWFCAPQSCAPENSEAFQGQHARDSTSFYIFDEPPGIHADIWRAAEGGLTDGEPMYFVGGNPNRNTGEFHRICFGSGRDRWQPRIIDARTTKLANKDLIAEWIADYGGEDSDFVRVRVRGLPPRASELAFVDADRIEAAQRRPDVTVFRDEPLVAGVDVSGGGNAWNVVRFRRGLDARSVPPIRLAGEVTRIDRSAFLAILAGLLRDTTPGLQLAAMFVDTAFGAPYVERLRAMGFDRVHEVTFGGHSPNRHQLNMRAYMWVQLKEWLARGGIIPATDVRLATDLAGPGYHLNAKDELVLESKESMQKRGVASPDDADALCLTFAAPVAVAQPPTELGPTARGRSWQAA